MKQENRNQRTIKWPILSLVGTLVAYAVGGCGPSREERLLQHKLDYTRNILKTIQAGIEVYRQNRGVYPDSLDNNVLRRLLPPSYRGELKDIFSPTEAPFVYDGRTSYSVGPNMIDDGGQPYDSETKSGDILPSRWKTE